MNRPAWPYAIAYIFPLITALGLYARGPWIFSGIAFVLILTPLLDSLGGLDLDNPPDEVPNQRLWRFDLILWLWLPTQLAILGYALTQADSLTSVERLGLALSLGSLTGAGGITIAHELMHRSNPYDKAIAEVLMSSVSYGHFCIEHVYGHHKNVATPEDPASSRLGESLYAFLPRTLTFSFRSAWQLEAARLQKSNLPAWKNRVLRSFALSLLFAGASYTLSLQALQLFLAQSLVAILLLELINYLEHYGLSRQQLPDGRFERVQPKHSWNSPHRVTSALLFNLPRHADHHANASRPYSALRHLENSPQLPAGYATMLLLALLPPLWRRVMDPKVQAWQNQ